MVLMSRFAVAAESALNRIKINAISKEIRNGRPVWVKRRRAAGGPVARFANLFFRWAQNPVYVWPRLEAWQEWEIYCFRKLNGDAFQAFAEGNSVVCAEKLPGTSLSEHLDNGTLTTDMLGAAALEFRRAHQLWCERFNGPWSHGDAHLANVLYDEAEHRARFIDFEVIHKSCLSAVERHADDLLVFLQDMAGRVRSDLWLPYSLAFIGTYEDPEVIAALKHRLVVPRGVPRVWWAVRTRCINGRELRQRVQALRDAL